MGSAQLGAAVVKVSNFSHDRLIVITDEQSADRVPEPKGLGYMINVASNRNGVGFGKCCMSTAGRMQLCALSPSTRGWCE